MLPTRDHIEPNFLLHLTEISNKLTRFFIDDAPIDQLDRSSGYGPEGWGFESSWAYIHYKNPSIPNDINYIVQNF